MNTRRTGGHTTFGSWLALQLDHAGLSPSRFAKRVGVSHVTVGRWLKGRQPDARYIDAIADVLVLDYDLVAERAGYRPAVDRSRLAQVHSRLDRYLERLSDEQVEGVRRILETLVGPLDAPTSPPDPPASSPPSLADRTGNAHGER